MRTPHHAAAARTTTKPIPIARPDAVLVLQPWSTATSQTKKRMMATTASTFIADLLPMRPSVTPDRGTSAFVTQAGDGTANRWLAYPSKGL